MFTNQRNWLKSIAQYFRLPTICTLCQEYHEEFGAICTDCQNYFSPIHNGCDICAFPLQSGRQVLCGKCVADKPHYDKVYASFIFSEPLRGIIHEFKYKQSLYLTSFLVRMMLKNPPPDLNLVSCFVPVPLHRKKFLERGFNQAAELAKKLGKIYAIKCESNLCSKLVHNLPQAQLSKKKRHKNIKNVFAVKPHNYSYVIIIDDLLTTGSTVNELAWQLKEKGADRVEIWCCARTN